MGTIGYMAPEQLLGHYSNATDVYCFALLAFELLTGERYADLRIPFDETWETSLRQAVRTHSLSDTTGTLFANGFAGTLSLELFNPEYWKQDPLLVAKTGLEKMKK